MHTFTTTWYEHWMNFHFIRAWNAMQYSKCTIEIKIQKKKKKKKKKLDDPVGSSIGAHVSRIVCINVDLPHHLHLRPASIEAWLYSYIAPVRESPPKVWFLHSVLPTCG